MEGVFSAQSYGFGAFRARPGVAGRLRYSYRDASSALRRIPNCAERCRDTFDGTPQGRCRLFKTRIHPGSPMQVDRARTGRHLTP